MPTNTLNEAAYKKSTPLAQQGRGGGRGSYWDNPNFGGGGGWGGYYGASSSGDDSPLIAYAMAQIQILQEIKGAIVALHQQRSEQFGEENKRRFDPYQVNNRLVQQGSQIGQAIARNQGASVVASTANMASDVLGMIPHPIAQVTSKLVGSFGTLVVATNALVDALVGRAKEIAHFSPAISIAEAKADVRRMMADIREAQALGNDYAALIEAQTDVEIEMRELLIPIKKAMIEAVIPTLQDIADILRSDAAKAVSKAVGGFLPTMNELATAGVSPLGGFIKWGKRMLSNTEDIKNNTSKEFEGTELIDELLKQIPNVGPNPVIGPAVVPIDQQLRVPLIPLDGM